MNSLPLFIYTTVRSGEPTYDRARVRRRHGPAALVLILFVLARCVARPRSDRPARRPE